jgi:hypothetical protein
MDHIDHPAKALWDFRKDWFESRMFEYEGNGGYLMGEQAVALVADVEASFCAGAWIAVVILAYTVIESNLREVEGVKRSSSVGKLIAQLGPEVDAMRMSRNRLVHVDPDDPAVRSEHQWDERERLEAEARSAVLLVFKALYSSPHT